MTQLLPLLAIFVVFWFMLIRPQQKRERERQAMLAKLKSGDRVVTSGGIIGRITGVSDGTVTLEVQDKVRLKVLRTHIAGPHQDKPGAASGAPAAPEPGPEGK